ncbi:MAG TPA: flagellar hook-associated protein FlgL [Candidatus Competibacter sp.]|nr:flagellar hook-associated protein FlgL [Candidatus Competibacter sp.]
MMRIATSQIYQQASKSIGDRQIALSRVQQQLASGSRILDHSDDPVGSARLLGLNDELGRYEQYQRNINLANSRLGIEDAALGSADELLQRARELTIQANTDTLNDSNRNNIAKEIRQLHDQLFNVANTRDGDGEYLFAGFQSNTQPFVRNGTTPSQIDYKGDQGQRLIKAGPTLDIAAGDPGTDVFGIDPSDPTKGAFAVLDRLATTLETSPATLHQDLGTSLQDLDQHLDSLSATRTKVGVRMKALEDQEYANDGFTLHLQQTISDVGGLDYAEAAARLSQETFLLQAAQQTFQRIQGLSLFNYMR